MPELRISLEKLCQFIEAARELSGRVPSTAGDRTTTGDDSALTFIEEREDDPTRLLMIEFVAGLNVEEQVDLVALIYLGRGDFELADWDGALNEARDRIEGGSSDYMIGSPALPEYLAAGLDAFDKACPDL